MPATAAFGLAPMRVAALPDASHTPVCSAGGRPRAREWARVAVAAAGVAAAAWVPGVVPGAVGRVREAAAAPVIIRDAERGGIPLEALGVKRENFMGERELRRRKTTVYSEAEQEIMELEEYDVETQWFRDLQIMWAGVASVGGMFVLYKGGVMWENWIQEQEKKDMEEEIELTGTFVDPRAVRKAEDEDDDDENKNKKNSGPDAGTDPSADAGGPDGDTGPKGDDLPPDGLDALEKLFGKS